MCVESMSDSSLQQTDSVAPKPKDHRVRFTPDAQRRIAELYVGGLTCQKIADMFGCASSRISIMLRKLGVKMRSQVPIIKIPKDKHPQIIELYEAGQSCKEIADDFGCKATCVYKILRKHDVKMRPKNSPGEYSKDIRQKMVDLYKQGHKLRSIAARFGCCVKTLASILDEYGIERRMTQYQPRYTEQDHQRMIAMYEQGKSLQEIADEIGCARKTIFHIFEKQGIETPPIPPRRFITPKERELIVKLYHQGKSHSEIAPYIGCVPQTVGKILRKLKLPIRVQGPDAYSDEDQQKMVDLYGCGMSLGEIAVGYKCGSQTVISILRKHDVRIRPRGYKNPITPTKRGKMLALYESGFSGAEIAEKLNCDLAVVASVVDFATRKSRVIQRAETTPHPNTIDDTKLPDREAPPQIPFETLVRDF
jgi:transposase-like protein